MAAALNPADNQQMIGQRRARSLASARQRSRFVAGVRLAIVVAAGLVALNALVQILMSSGGGEPAPELTLSPQGDAERIINPRFTGRDQSGVPFIITAEAAERRSGAQTGIADLIRPTLDYVLLEGGADASRVLADSGVFNEVDQTLQLNSNVRMNTRSGYAFSTQSATLHLQDGRVSNQAPVFGQAPWGAVRADSFEVREEGQRIILRGDVRTRFYAPAPPPPSDAQPSEESQP